MSWALPGRRPVFLLTSRFLATVLLLDRCDYRDAVTTIGRGALMLVFYTTIVSL